MESTEKYLYHYRRLLNLLDEDSQNISSCIQGELLDLYLVMLKRETDIINSSQNPLK